MRKTVFVLWMSLALFVLAGCLGGCDEYDYQKIDRAVDTAQRTTEQGEKFLDSPIGRLLVPPNYQEGIKLGGAIAVGLIIGWKQWRKKQQLQKVAKSIVAGIEKTGTDGKNVKLNIAEAMKDNGVYGQGKAIVRDLKNA